jgi:hypothetical protein
MLDPTSEAEWKALVGAVLEGKSNGYVRAAILLAHRFAKDAVDMAQLNEQLTVVQTRCTEVVEQRRALVSVIEKLAAAHPDARDAIIAEALSAARSCK